MDLQSDVKAYLETLTDEQRAAWMINLQLSYSSRTAPKPLVRAFGVSGKPSADQCGTAHGGAFGNQQDVAAPGRAGACPICPSSSARCHGYL